MGREREELQPALPEIRVLEWDSEREAHIARHGVTIDEVGEVFRDLPFLRRVGGKVYQVFGQTDAGRYLMVVALGLGNRRGWLRTAREMTQSERRMYLKRRKQRR